jgi:hypothetical protein
MSSISCFQGSGGYSTTKGFDTIVQKDETSIASFDITGAVEVYYDVRTINNLIGIQKDISNIDVTSSNYYDNENDILLNDNFVISADMFVKGLNNSLVPTKNVENVLSVGSLSSMYSDFAQYIALYFGLPSITSNDADGQGIAKGLATLYGNDYNFNPNNGIFDGRALLDILNAVPVNSTNASQRELTGNIELVNITSSLRNAVTTNPFGNRTRDTGVTASDETNRSNYGTSDGFFEGDVIYIAGGPKAADGALPSSGYYGNGYNDGILFSLNLAVDPNVRAVNGDVDPVNLITRSVGAPLVIHLKNMSACVLKTVLGNITTNSISISITGIYESIVIKRSYSSGGNQQSTVYTDYDLGVLSNGYNYLDSDLQSYYNYSYTFTPIDANGYSGITQIVSATTSSN